jgi:hypothetical protein
VSHCVEQVIGWLAVGSACRFAVGSSRRVGDGWMGVDRPWRVFIVCGRVMDGGRGTYHVVMLPNNVQ